MIVKLLRIFLPLLGLAVTGGMLYHLFLQSGHLHLKTPLLVRMAEDAPEQNVSIDLNSTHPEKTLLYLELDQDAPIEARIEYAPLRITVKPLENRFGTTMIRLHAELGGVHRVRNIPVDITPQNDPPIPMSRTLRTEENRMHSGHLEAVDPDYDVLRFELIKAPRHGTLTLSASGAFTYTPPPGFSGEDGFLYRVTDPSGVNREQLIAITVEPRNDPPVATDMNLSTPEENVLTGTLKIDDPDSADLTVTLITPPRHGKVELLAHHRFRYTPDRDFAGADTFRYQVSDGMLLSRIGEVRLKITNRNDAPMSRDHTVSCAEDTPCEGNLSASDADGDPLTFLIADLPRHGILELSEKGRFRYMPAPLFHGQDSFRFTVKDPAGQSAQANVILTVTSEQDDVRADLGRLAGAEVRLYDYDTLGTSEPVPIYTATTSKGKRLEQMGVVDLPLDKLRREGLYILTFAGGEDYDYDYNGKPDSRPVPNRGTLHMAASGSQLKGEHCSANILTELLYRHIGTRLKSGYDAPNLLETLDRLSGDYLQSDLTGDGKISYADILAFDYRRDRNRLKLPWDEIKKQSDRLHQNAVLETEFKTPCRKEASSELTYDLALHEGNILLAEGSNGLSIAKNTQVHTEPLGHLNTRGYTRAIDLEGSLAFLADGSLGVQVVDISSVAEPRILATVDTPWYALDIRHSRSHLYIADGSSGLAVINVRDPNNPTMVSLLETGGYAFALHSTLLIAGNFR